MNYGPIEFADYLRRNPGKAEPATVRAARAAQPSATTPAASLRVVSGPAFPLPEVHSAAVERLDVCEALAMNPPCRRAVCTVRISLVSTERPLILVLSSHQTVQWHVSVAPAAELRALFISGFGRSVISAGNDVPAHRIGGFYAFRRGSVEFHHLESEVRRCTGGAIGQFRSIEVGDSLELRPE
jgi:hypothetical protein